MDYKDLVKRINEKRIECAHKDAYISLLMERSVIAIETLLAEREAAVSALKGMCEDTGDGCELCKHMPCTEEYGRCIGWEWNGLTFSKHEPTDD